MEMLVGRHVARGMEEDPVLWPHGGGAPHLAPQTVVIVRGGGYNQQVRRSHRSPRRRPPGAHPGQQSLAFGQSDGSGHHPRNM
ncbi:hypothetical protein NQ317_005771, partial [Molorchus minor]